MEISPTRANATPLASPPPTQENSDRAQRQKQAQALEAEKRTQSSPPPSYLNTQGQTTGRMLNTTA